MKRLNLWRLNLILLFAFSFLTAGAQDVTTETAQNDEKAAVAQQQEPAAAPSNDDLYAVSDDEVESLTAESDALADGTLDATDYNTSDIDLAEYGPQLSPLQYAKVKTKRKIADLVLRFLINTLFCFIITRFFYFPKSRRRDFFFTYILVGFAIFMLIHLMSGETMETGIGMGLFAIFCIMRYRTESVPIREMTYLFVIIALAALNGMAWDISMKKPQFMHREIIAMSELLLTNLLFVVIVWLAEGKKFAKGLSSKYIRYDKIDLILPEKRDELIADLQARTGLEITSVSIGSIDFLKDMALLKVFYKDNGEEEENTDRLPKGF